MSYVIAKPINLQLTHSSMVGLKGIPMLREQLAEKLSSSRSVGTTYPQSSMPRCCQYGTSLVSSGKYNGTIHGLAAKRIISSVMTHSRL